MGSPDGIESWRLAVLAALGSFGCAQGDIERDDVAATSGEPSETDPTTAQTATTAGSVAVVPPAPGSTAVVVTGPVPTTPLGREVTCTLEADDAHIVDCIPGATHRLGSPACEDRRTVRPAEDTELPPAATFVTCEYDSDCSATPLGYCQQSVPLGASCLGGCLGDDDCQLGSSCECTGNVGACLTSGCRSDDDCEAGALCLSWTGACGASAFECTTDADTCRSGEDCPQGTFCQPTANGRACVVGPAACPVPGRPFIVDGIARVAPVMERVDWTLAVPELPQLPAVQGERIGRHWLEAALMEHASIASFARFQLQLLALGAPLELVARAAQAMRDETRHARACFTLASAYLRRNVGPGRLDLDGSPGKGSSGDGSCSKGSRGDGCCSDGAREPWTTDASEMLRALVLEGCVGETCAAHEALAAAERATVPEVRDVLIRIARDEREHALLAWRTLAWLLRAEPGLSRVVSRLASELEASATNSDGRHRFGDPDAAHGVLSLEARRALRDEAVREIVCPGLAAALGSDQNRVQKVSSALP